MSSNSSSKRLRSSNPEERDLQTPVRRSKRIAERKARNMAPSTKAVQIPHGNPTMISCSRVAAAAQARARRNRRAQAVASLPSSPPPAPKLSGLFDVLPVEVLDIVLNNCSTRQLAILETTCCFFKHMKMVESIAERRLRAIPRAKGITPNPVVHEKYTSILHFIMSQSAAAAQATALSFGANHTAALLIPVRQKPESHHSLYTFGRGFYGQLGHKTFEDKQQPELLCIGYQPALEQPDMEEEITPAVVSCGAEYTTSITRRGQLLTWGLGSRGELGHELPRGEVPFPVRAILTGRPTIRIVSVACGSSHTLAISETGNVWSCGRNQDGQLGNGTFADEQQLQLVHGINRAHRIVSCAAGASHSMALASDGSLYTWGCGKNGQLGHSSLHAIHLMVPNQIIVLATPQKVAALEPASLKPYKRVTSIASGAHHACAVTVSGAMLMFGRNRNGQLGTGDSSDRWGPTEINLAAGSESRDSYRTVQVSCGLQHTLALVAHNGRVKAFSTGGNVFGQLGMGSQQASVHFKPIPKLAPLDVVALQAGDHTSAAICENGDVWLWGRNTHCQLGTGDDIGRWTPTQLQGFTAVHPDKTLRKSKRTAPRMRKVAAPAVPAVPKVCNMTLVFGHKSKQQSTPLPHSTNTSRDAVEHRAPDRSAAPELAVVAAPGRGTMTGPEPETTPAPDKTADATK